MFCVIDNKIYTTYGENKRKIKKLYVGINGKPHCYYDCELHNAENINGSTLITKIKEINEDNNMVLKQLLDILPDNLDITIEHDGCKTSSLVRGIKAMNWLNNRKVLSASPNYVHAVNIQSFNVRVIDIN